MYQGTMTGGNVGIAPMYPQGVCPACGHCPYCGRGNSHPYFAPVHPFYPVTPVYPNPWGGSTWISGNNVQGGMSGLQAWN